MWQRTQGLAEQARGGYDSTGTSQDSRTALSGCLQKAEADQATVIEQLKAEREAAIRAKKDVELHELREIMRPSFMTFVS